MSVSGDFAHRKDDASVAIEGAADNAAAFRKKSTARISPCPSHLPAGKYTIVIGEAETLLGAPGERSFDVTCGDVALAKNFDIVAAAGAVRKVCYITGQAEHEDDSIKGPLTISFAANKGAAKFNTVEIKDSSGASVTSFSALELAGVYSGDATRVPQISDPPIWRDPSQPLQARENDLSAACHWPRKSGNYKAE